MRRLRAHPLAGFFALALGITWTAWFTRAASSHGLIPVDIPLLYLVGGIGPGVAAVLVMRAVHGKDGDTVIRNGLLRWRVPAIWYAVALLLPLVVQLGTAAITGGFAAFWRWGAPGAVLSGFALYLVQAVPEEVGWRGFALPRLQARHSALLASLLLGAVWGLWHLPLLLTAGDAMSTYPKLAYFLDIMATAVLYTWLYNSTSGSVLIVTVFHATTNVFGPFVAAEAVVTAALAIVVVVVFGPTHLSRHRGLTDASRVQVSPRSRPLARSAGRASAVAALAVPLTAALTMPAMAAERDPLPPVNTAAVDAFVESQMSKHGFPGLALAIIEEDDVTYARGFGTAGGSGTMTADTPVPLGSTTKAFTAVAVLQLVEQGLLELDAPVATYLPWFRVADDVASRSITVRHLLNHTSGLSDVGYNRVPGGGTSLADGVRDLRHARSAAPAGRQFRYFNGNYSTLALIVETVSGQLFGDYVRDHVYEPLDMRHSGAEGSDPPDGTAQGHSKLFGFAVARTAPPYPSMLGAGHLVSTAPELARLGVALANDGVYRGTRILAPASVEMMRTPPAAVGGTYGMGWIVDREGGERVESHDGAGPTSMSQLVMLPDRDSGYALVINQEHLVDAIVALPQLRDGLLALLTGKPPQEGGSSTRLIGGGLLAITVVVAALAIRSLRMFPDWRRRAPTMSTRQLVHAIAPRLVIPLAVVAAAYRVSPAVVGNPFNIGWVGRWYVPDILLLLAVSTVPDVLLGLSMLATAIRQHRTTARSLHRTTSAAPVGAGAAR